MTKKLMICIGDYGSGKTVFACKYASAHGMKYLDYDFMRRDGYDEFIKRLKFMVDNSSESLILDGWGEFPTGLTRLDRIIDAEIVLCFVFARPDVIEARQEHKTNRRPLEEIEYYLMECYRLVCSWDYGVMFIDTTNGIEEVVEFDALQRITELIFLSDLEKYQHDKYYQDIELPSGAGITGYSESSRTWERIAGMDYEGAKVLDVGSFHGYFSFKAEEQGAEVTGIDACAPAVEVAKNIAYLRHSGADFRVMKAEDINTDWRFDIVFCLNMIHHCDHPSRVIEKLFNIGRCIVFEVNAEPWQAKIEADAIVYNAEVTLLSSHRAGRVIMVCRRDNAPRIEKAEAFKYHYRWERLKWWCLEKAGKVYRGLVK